MNFYYENKLLNTENPIYHFLINNGVEYSNILFEKMSKVYKDISFIKISGYDEKNELKIFLTIGRVENQKVANFFLLNKIVDNSSFGIRAIEKYLKIDKVTFEIIHEKNQKDLNFELNQEKINYCKNIYKSFFNIKKECIIQDKYNEDYKLIIVENCDPNIMGGLIKDIAILAKNEEIIGYLEVKYTTKEIINKEKLNDDKDIHSWNNVATVDYSIIKEDYRNKGLGYSLYFHMGQYLNNKGIEFRESSIQTDKARRLWDGIQNHLKNYTKVKKIDNNNYLCFLKIGKNCNLVFENNKPMIIKTLNK